MYFFYGLFLIIFLIVLTVGLAAFSFAPWLPVKSRDLKRIFKLANLKSGEMFYDLGCGDGRVVRYAAKNFNVLAVGIELALPLLWYCKLSRIFLPNKDMMFKWRNLFSTNLALADVVYFFGIPSSIKDKLRQKLEQELRPGTRVISYAFKIDGWRPHAVDKPDDKNISIYLYVV